MEDTMSHEHNHSLEHRPTEPDFTDIYSQQAATEPNSHVLLCKTAKGSVAGYIAYALNRASASGKDSVELKRIYVTRRYRGRGVAERLAQAVAAEADRRGLRKIEWQCARWDKRTLAMFRVASRISAVEWSVHTADQGQPRLNH
jgi:GNAT superfamily N-acetyltransferase